jgi:hypothetical protein
VEPKESFAAERNWFKVIAAVASVFVWLAVFRAEPGAGVLLAVLGMPILIASAWKDRPKAAPPRTFLGLLGSLIMSICLVLLVGVCSIIALFLLCIVSAMN